MLAAKIKVQENIQKDGEVFTVEEWAHFKDEINKQMAGGSKIIDFAKAVNNARYLAMLDKAFADMEAGRWTEHELIEVGEDE